MSCSRRPEPTPRRDFLGDMGTGLLGVALTSMLGSDRAAAADVAPRTVGPHFQPKARRVLQIFCPGAVSQMDTFDYKPALARHHGEPLPGLSNALSFQGKNGNLMKSPWSFEPRGESGKMISELFAHLGGLADDMAFIHSMTSKTNTHGPGCVFMNTGFATEGFPSAGSWISYALGSLNQNLPTFVAIPDVRGEPPNGPANWNSGFLPAEHQAVVFNAAEPIGNLATPSSISSEAEQDSRRFLSLLNRLHQERFPGNDELDGRVAAYEMAARMQLSAPEASELARETRATHRLYGTDDPNPLKAAYARNCLLARRLLERDVRYVTLYCASRASGVDGLLNWDAHKTLKADYERHVPIFDQPTAALIQDMGALGMLDDTLVLWTTEFGRMPTHQDGTQGRDHNPNAFTVWMLGAGVRGGTTYGATDEFGYKAVENVATVYDFYATVLHLLGLDHKRATFYHNGIERRLTDVHGHVIQDVLA